MTRSLILTVALLTACKDGGPVDSGLDSEPVVIADDDGDGFDAETDCDDGNAAVFPGAEELCNGLDDDCDGEVDNGASDQTTWYADEDGDGYGAGDPSQACEPPEGSSATDDDCDDADAAYNPGAVEDDCTDPNDYNCDGTVGYADADGDGWPACEDCDDADAALNPAALEACDGVDNDCDGLVDDEDENLDLSTASTWYADVDQDGYGTDDVQEVSCEPTVGFVGDDTDCDDGDAAVNPGATEVCNGIDDDCDALIDDTDDSLDSSTATIWYADADSDGYGDASAGGLACDQPSGSVADSSDCDDGAAAVNPGAAEVCNSIDDDCDALIDDADGSLDSSTATTWYADADGDGYGDANVSSLTCAQPTGTVTDNTDCDDSSGAVSPGATEVCNGLDDDCDTQTDDADNSLDSSTASTWYADADADGYGDSASSSLSCDQPSASVSDATDCDDGDAAVNPGSAELCDGLDNDCDSSSDEGVLGADLACPAETCAEVLADQSSAVDGSYALDPDGNGAALYECDMSTDSGGWTLVLDWDRANDGDTLADFESLMTRDFRNMGVWRETGSHIRWEDGNASADVMAYSHEVEVPNGGELLHHIYYRGHSMEQSGTWFFGEGDSGSFYDLYCWEYIYGAYTSAELAWQPYSCGNSTSSTSFTWNTVTQDSLGEPVSAVHLRSLHYDNSSGDYSRLYQVEAWVR